MSWRDFFTRLGRAKRELHEPREGYGTLEAAKFFRQVVTADSRASRTLMWNSLERLEGVELEYEMVGEGAASFGNVTANFFEMLGGSAYIYSATLEGLKPASMYRYRVIAGGRATDWRNFRTAGDGEFEMLVFSDSQCVDYEVWRRTAEAADRAFPDAEIFVVNGDLVDNGANFRQWNAWYGAAENLLRERILAPNMGNHECYGKNWLNCLPSGYLHNFKLPPNGARNFGGYFYSFDYGAAHFFVLNTQFGELENFNAGLSDAQEYWFRRDAADSNRPWRIVFMHKSVYNRALSGFVEEAERYFLPLFDELEIDLVISGHLHTYRNGGQIFARKKARRGPHYILCGRSGDQNYTREPESYLALKVNAQTLALQSRSVAGEIWDELTLKK